MLEIEIKILDINPSKINDKIIALGGVKTGEHKIHEIYFDVKPTLRLRKVGDKVEFCSKKHVKNNKFKIHEEIETEIKDFDIMKQILLRYYKIKLEDKKVRTSFKINNTHLEIDKYEGIPAYLEIEGVKKDIVRIVKELGFNMKDTVTWNSYKVKKFYSK